MADSTAGAGDCADIDTTPTIPQPPTSLVDRAARDIPDVFADVAPRDSGAMEINAASLADRLRQRGHSLAAAQWAIHNAVLVGRLAPKRIEYAIPAFGQRSGGTMRHLGGPDDRMTRLSGGGISTYVLPKGKPAPYDKFKVVATQLLWDWWKIIEAGDSASGEEGGGNSKPLDAVLQEGTEPSKEPGPESATGFLGGAKLANALGVHPTRQDAFFQRLLRERISLGDDSWHEVSEPRPNSPRYHYRVDSAKVRDLAAKYKAPKADQ